MQAEVMWHPMQAEVMCGNCGQEVMPLPARFSAIFHTCTKVRRVGKQKVQKVPIFGEHVTLAYRPE